MNSLSVSTIIFDFDGVLVDTGSDIAHAANYVLECLGLGQLPTKTITSYIGGGAEPLVSQCLRDKGADDQLARALPMFKARYAEHYFQDTTCYTGVRPMLAQFHSAGKRMAIATNKVERLTWRILEALELAHFFQSVVGSDSVAQRKPHPEALQKILAELQVEPEHSLMIGDAPTDILAGKAAGARTCGVTYGYGTYAEIVKTEPDFIIDEISQLPDYIK